MEVKFTIPEQLVNVQPETWLLIGVVTLIGILASVILEVVRRRYYKKHHEQLAKKATAYVLTAVSTVITAASYFILFAAENSSILALIPFVGEKLPQVLGIAYIFYNVGGNKLYQSAANALSKWSRDKTPVVETILPVSDAVVSENAAPDVLR